jgi:hypothetical protein
MTWTKALSYSRNLIALPVKTNYPRNSWIDEAVNAITSGAQTQLPMSENV